MKATILIERTLANTFTIDLPETYIPTSSGILDYAGEVYEKMVDRGEEPELGDQIDSSLHLHCMECNQEIEEGEPIAVEDDGRIVCPFCHTYMALRKPNIVEIDLSSTASKIVDMIRKSNREIGTARSAIINELLLMIEFFARMNIGLTIHGENQIYDSFTLNGKRYNV